MLRWRVGNPSWLNPQRIAIYPPKNTSSSCGLYLCRYPITDQHLIRLLEALRQTVLAEQQYVSWDTVHRFSDIMDTFFSTVSLQTWGWYFQPQFVDSYDICTKVFAIFAGIVAYVDPTPSCPLRRCVGAQQRWSSMPARLSAGGTDALHVVPRCRQRNTIRYDSVCLTCSKKLTGSQLSLPHGKRRKRNVTDRKACRGSVAPTSNTWLANGNCIGTAIFLTFLWTCRIRVTQAAMHANTSQHTAVDFYSLSREVCEVVMSNELLQRPMGGEG